MGTAQRHLLWINGLVIVSTVFETLTKSHFPTASFKSVCYVETWLCGKGNWGGSEPKASFLQYGVGQQASLLSTQCVMPEAFATPIASPQWGACICGTISAPWAPNLVLGSLVMLPDNPDV